MALGNSASVVSPRSAGWAAILCIAVVAIALFVPGYPLPSAADSGASVSAFLDAHRSAWLLGAWLTFPELAFFLWFFIGLRAYLRKTADVDEGLMLYMLAGAISTVAAGLVATTLQIVLGVLPSAALGAVAVKTLYVGWLASGVPVLFMALAATLFPAAVALKSNPEAPASLAIFGYAATVFCVLGTVTTFFVSGPFALNGPVGYIAFFVFAVWAILTGIHLIRSR